MPNASHADCLMTFTLTEAINIDCLMTFMLTEATVAVQEPEGSDTLPYARSKTPGRGSHSIHRKWFPVDRPANQSLQSV
eukprot:6143510-Pleurochrysis_carterae.AAC.2